MFGGCIVISLLELGITDEDLAVFTPVFWLSEVLAHYATGGGYGWHIPLISSILTLPSDLEMGICYLSLVVACHDAVNRREQVLSNARRTRFLPFAPCSLLGMYEVSAREMSPRSKNDGPLAPSSVIRFADFQISPKHLFIVT